MVAFQGSLSENVKKKTISRQNYDQGIKELIAFIFASAPIMLLILLLIGSESIGEGTTTQSGVDFTEFLNDSTIALYAFTAVGLIFYVGIGVNAIKHLIFPCTKKELAKKADFKCMINEDGVKYQYNGVNRFLSYKNIKKIYDDPDYFEITGKKIARGFVVEKSCCFEGNVDEVYNLFGKKLSKVKQTSKAKNDSNYLYAIIGMILSVLLVVFAKEILNLTLAGVVFMIEKIVDEFLIPVSEYFFTWLTPTDNVWANLVVDAMFILPAVIAILGTIWILVLGPTIFLLLLIFPAIVSASFILPLKQLTINKKPLSYIGVIVAVIGLVLTVLRIFEIL